MIWLPQHPHGRRKGGSQNSEKEQIDVGFNYYIHPRVVLKADYFDQDNDSGTEYNGYNLGVGYDF